MSKFYQLLFVCVAFVSFGLVGCEQGELFIDANNERPECQTVITWTVVTSLTDQEGDAGHVGDVFDKGSKPTRMQMTVLFPRSDCETESDSDVSPNLLPVD